MKSKVNVIINVIWAIITFLLFAVAFSIRWMLQTWVHLTMEELVYTITSLEGAGGGMVFQYVINCVVPAVLVMMVLISVTGLINRQMGSSLWVQAGGTLISLVLLICFGIQFWTKLDVATYLANQSADAAFIEQNYVNPLETNMDFPEEERNLIYIYLESMETTYADEESGGGFTYNCIPELTELAQVNEDFSGFRPQLNGGYAVAGSTWTMGALFSQTAGIPLQITIDRNSMNTQESFFQEW